MVTMDELFHGLLVYSGNDAAMAIAEHLGGSVEHFVEMMNEEARALGATNTILSIPPDFTTTIIIRQPMISI